MSDLTRILIAPLVWLAAFSAVYGLHGVICGFGLAGETLWGLSLARLALVGAFVVTLVVQAIVLVGLYAPRLQSRAPFVRFVSRATGWVGLVAALWSLFPVVVTSYC